MKTDSRPQFSKHQGIQRRANKIKALADQASPEARKARKDMNTTVYRRGRTNTNGFFGVQRITRRTKKKERGIKVSPQLRLALAGRL